MKTRMKTGIALVLLASWAVFTTSAWADKGEIKSIGFDMSFSEHPEQNPDVVEIYEGDTIKVVLHQSSVFDKEGLNLPDKEYIESGESYFVYPGQGCAQNCVNPMDPKLTSVHPFTQKYYVLSPQLVGQNTKVVLMNQAVVVGDKITDKIATQWEFAPKKVHKGYPTGDTGHKGALPNHPDGPAEEPEDGSDDECIEGDPEHPCVKAKPLDVMNLPTSKETFTEAMWSSASIPASFGLDVTKGLRDGSYLSEYFDYCSDQLHSLDYRYWYVDEGVVEEMVASITIPAFDGGKPFIMWFEEQVEANSNEHILVTFSNGRIYIEGRTEGTRSTFADTGLPNGTVVAIEVQPKTMNACEGIRLGFDFDSETLSFPYTHEIPEEVYGHKKWSQARSNVCAVDEALTEAVRPRLPSPEHKVFVCPFEKKAVLAGPFWAFFTTQHIEKKKKKKGKADVTIAVKGDPVLVMSNGQKIVNVEARISWDGSAAATESFHSPTLDTPIYYYVIEKAKAGVYAITPVINVEDPSMGPGQTIQKPGRVILVKVQSREAHSLIRLQMGVISYSEFRAMAFTVMITPILNPKSFFKRKFLPAPYPMPHIGLRLGSNEDVLGLQVGLGIALLKEFIIVGGLQFGTKNVSTPWDWRKAWYIGVAIDPWLLQKSISAAARKGGG